MVFNRDEYIESLRRDKILLTKKVEKLTSSYAYVKMEEEIAKLKRSYAALRDSHKKLQEKCKTLKDENTTLNSALKTATKTVESISAENILLKEKNKELEERLAEYEEANKKLSDMNARYKKNLNTNSSNSSLPSSKNPIGIRKPTNNREKSDKKPGAQLNHVGHRRVIPDTEYSEVIELTHPNASQLTPTDRYKERVCIDIDIKVIKRVYKSKIYIDANGKEVYAPFPKHLTNNELSYSPKIKACLYLLMSKCNVSVMNAQEFISNLTGNKLNISTGFIHGLINEFKNKTEDERNEIFKNLVNTKVMHVDFTNATLNGKSKQVIICCDNSNVYYGFRDHKGHKGVEGSPLSVYDGIVCSDHDLTFYSYGSSHQECLVHILRYLKGCMEIEKDLKWIPKMRSHIKDLFKLCKERRDSLTSEEIERIRQKYDEIIQLGDDEYKANPPGWYKEGFNLHKRLKKYKESTLLFLTDIDIPLENNCVEQKGRTLKRKIQQMTGFRSAESASDLCAGFSVIETLKLRNQDIFETVTNIFAR